jgi:hypothetical protein
MLDATLEGGNVYVHMRTFLMLDDVHRFSLSLVTQVTCTQTWFDAIIYSPALAHLLDVALLYAMLFGRLRFLHTTSHVRTTSQWIKQRFWNSNKPENCLDMAILGWKIGKPIWKPKIEHMRLYIDLAKRDELITDFRSVREQTCDYNILSLVI